MGFLVIKHPITGEEIQASVPEGVTQEQAQARFNEQYKQAELSKDIAKSAISGPAQGAFNALKVPAQAATGLIAPVVEKIAGQLGFDAEKLRNLHTQGVNAFEGAANKIEDKTGMNYEPTTQAGRYVKAGGAGIGGAVLPMGGASTLTNGGLGLISGLLSQHIKDTPSLFGEQTDFASSAAGMVPFVAAMAKRYFIPSAAEKAKQGVKDAFKGTGDVGINEGTARMAEALARSKQQGDRVPIFPGQAFGEQHPIVGMHKKAAAGSPEFQQKLAEQLATAEALKSRAVQPFLPDGTPNPNPIATGYREGGVAPLSREQAARAASNVRGVAAPGTPANPTGMNLSVGSPQEQFVNRIADRIMNQGTENVPPTFRTDPTFRSPELNPVSNSPRLTMRTGDPWPSDSRALALPERGFPNSAKIPINGDPVKPALNLVQDGERTTMVSPGGPRPRPADNFGVLLHERQIAKGGKTDDVSGQLTANLRRALNNVLKENDQIAASDAMLGPLKENVNAARIGQRAEGTSAIPKQTTIPFSAINPLNWPARVIQGNVPEATAKILSDPSGKQLAKALAYSRMRTQLLQGAAGVTESQVLPDVAP